MKKKKLLILLPMVLLIGMSACSTKKENTINSDITPVSEDVAGTATPTKEVATPTPETVTPTEDVTTPTPEVDEKTTESILVPDTASGELTSYYASIGTLDDNYQFAASYVDTFTADNATDQIKDYASKHNLETYDIVDCNGLECYVVIPKYEGTTITVDLYSDFEADATERMISTSNPVFVLCNPSDIFGNTEIVVTNEDQKLVFTPCMSLKDGSAILPEEANQDIK